jgi:hypothetical protein
MTQVSVGEIENIPWLFYNTYKNDNYNYKQYLYLLVTFKTVSLSSRKQSANFLQKSIVTCN